MLFLLFELGGDRYALEAGRIAEVLPLVRIKRLPRAPAGVAGVFDYRGAPVPVIDLSQLALGRPAQQRLSTRIVVVHYPDGDGQHLLGLIAEKAAATLRREPADFSDSGVTSDARGLVQRIEVERLLPQAVRELLFRPAAG